MAAAAADEVQANGFKGPNYAEEKVKILAFLGNYHDGMNHKGRRRGRRAPRPKYMKMLSEVKKRKRITVDVDLDDILETKEGHALVENIKRNTKRYIDLFSESIDELLGPAPSEVRAGSSDRLDTLTAVRMRRHTEALAKAAADGQLVDPKMTLPPQLMRRYEVRFLPEVKSEFVPLRQVSAEHIGALVCIKAMVTRASDVKPMVEVVTYVCDDCGMEIYQTVASREFMPLTECPGTCKQNNLPGRLHTVVRGCKFTKFQEFRVQELPEQVPVGNIPRSLTCIARGEMCRQVSPGDLITLTGIFLPTPYTGFRRIKAGLLADTYLDVQGVERVKKTYTELEMQSDLVHAVKTASKDKDVYDRLAASIAPEIYGHVDIKKALLLMLVGGVTRNMGDGMRIRGDINICLMGDPGVAKSQLLKHIAGVAPRGVYTTGKGSSGVGLTAAVLRDPLTKELMLEGGALVMADMGICCIDEFDKMEDADRTAIHEVMEQQTVSIAKAGITTTLNARTAILAAANPLYGRYNRKLTPTQNINLPAALLSRFDLLYLILDKPDTELDRNLAMHVTYVHQNGTHPPVGGTEYMAPSFVRAYVAEARKVEPWVSDTVTAQLVEAYVDMRRREAVEAKQANEQTVMTARRLLSILRLAQAHARLRMSSEVAAEDVEEAIRLVNMSKASLIDEDSNRTREDPTSAIFRIIKDKALSSGKGAQVEITDVTQPVLMKGFTQEELAACLNEYADLNVWQLNADKTRLAFIDSV